MRVGYSMAALTGLPLLTQASRALITAPAILERGDPIESRTDFVGYYSGNDNTCEEDMTDSGLTIS
jgi:hypothetical protein